ncbi:MAG: hypothetical protein ABIH92_01825, partial [Nanoarchaeota archaeon]
AMRLLILFMFLSLVSVIQAADSTRTVSEFGIRVFENLGYKDTLNGSEGFDSIKCYRNVMDAATTLGSTIGKPQAKRIVTASGTMAYEIDERVANLSGVLMMRNRYAVPVKIFQSIDDLLGALVLQGEPSDTSYNGCAVHGDSLYLHPIPRRVDSLYLFYTARGIDAFTSADTVKLPYEYYQPVEWLATIMSAAQIGDMEAFNTYMKLYKSGGAE